MNVQERLQEADRLLGNVARWLEELPAGVVPAGRQRTEKECLGRHIQNFLCAGDEEKEPMGDRVDDVKGDKNGEGEKGGGGNESGQGDPEHGSVPGGQQETG